MPMGKMWLSAPRASYAPRVAVARPANATNYVRRRRYRKKGKIAPTTSFKKAYNSLLPSKLLGVQGTKELLASVGSLIGEAIAQVELYTLVPGPLINQRQNNLIYASYVNLAITAANNSTIKTKGLCVIIIQPRSPRKGDLNSTTFQDVLFNTSVAEGTPNSPAAITADAKGFVNNINTEKYKVYSDRKFKLKPEGEGTFVIKYSTRLGQIIEFDKNASADSSSNNPIYVIPWICNLDNTPSSASVTFSMQTKAYFKDYNKRYRNSA